MRLLKVLIFAITAICIAVITINSVQQSTIASSKTNTTGSTQLANSQNNRTTTASSKHISTKSLFSSPVKQTPSKNTGTSAASTLSNISGQKAGEADSKTISKDSSFEIQSRGDSADKSALHEAEQAIHSEQPASPELPAGSSGEPSTVPSNENAEPDTKTEPGSDSEPESEPASEPEPSPVSGGEQPVDINPPEEQNPEPNPPDSNQQENPQDNPATNGVLIIAPPSATVEQAQKWAKSRGATQTFIDIAPLFWELSALSGVDPAVAYAQSAKETGFGRFTGVLDASFHNTCGLKTTQGGGNEDPNAHMRFSDWSTGILAHLDHLALYAGAPGYPKGDSPDPRHFPSLYGKAKTVEELGGKWAPSTDYGISIVRDYLTSLRNTK